MPKPNEKAMEPNLRSNADKRKVGDNNSLSADEKSGLAGGQGPTRKRMRVQDDKSFVVPATKSVGENKIQHEDTLLRDDDSRPLDPISQSMEERLLSTTVGVENRRDSTGSESGGSTNSDKFYSEIKQKAEKTVVTPKSELPEQKPDVSKWMNNNNGPSSLAENKEELVSRSYNVHIKIVDPFIKKTIFDTKNHPIKTTHSTIQEFLKAHDRDFDLNQSTGSNKSMKVSLGSTILRPSLASTLNRPSSIMGEIVTDDSDSTMVNPVKVAKRRKKGEFGPILSSTHIGEEDEMDIMDKSEAVEIPSRPPKTNGTAMTSSYTSSSNATSSSSFSTSSRSRRQDSMDQEKKLTKPKGYATEEAADKFNDHEFTKSVTLWGTINPDQVVFARWRDKKYYSGKITKKGSNDTWCIHFDDNMDDVASESHILPVKVLGTKTYAVYCPEDKFKEELVIIVGHRSLKGQDETGVAARTEYACISDLDGRVIICKRQNLSLYEHDARELRKDFQPPAMVTKAADLNVGNIVREPRRRTGAKSPPPSTVIRQLVAGAFDASSTDSQVFKDAMTPVAIKPSVSRRSSSPSSSTKGEPKNIEDPPKAKTKDIESPFLPDHVDQGKSMENKIFDGLQFFLTASGPPEGICYDKDELRMVIENNGGEVLDTVGKEVHNGNNVFLISDQYARTVKYIYSLAAGIPCISYKWINACLDKNEVIDYKDYYQLKSGWSISECQIIEPHSLKPLKKMKIFVTSDSGELYNYWKPVLTVADAMLLKKAKVNKNKKTPPPLIPEGAEVLVTDTSCPKDIRDIARAKGIPLVKPEWLVQTIITGKKVPFDDDEKYMVTDREIDAHFNAEED